MDNTDQFKINVSAYREDTEPSRIIRLERVIGYVCALSDVSGSNEVLNKVSSLHDHKGTLTVKWKQSPTEEEKVFFLKAWQSIIGDIGDSVVHEMEE